jgi:hypothetical protein
VGTQRFFESETHRGNPRLGGLEPSNSSRAGEDLRRHEILSSDVSVYARITKGSSKFE